MAEGVSYKHQFSSVDFVNPAKDREEPIVAVNQAVFVGLYANTKYLFRVQAVGDGKKYSATESPGAEVTAITTCKQVKTIPMRGHQADRIVQYTIVGNPDEFFKKAIVKAAAMWNAAMGLSSPDGAGILFCQRQTDPTRLPGATICPYPTSTDDDGYTVTIEVVPSTDLGVGCNKGIACVGGENGGAIKVDKDGNLLDMHMYIEDDTKVKVEGVPTPVVWTIGAKRHGEEATLHDGSKGIYVDLLAVLIHEFGHTAGAKDICDELFGEDREACEEAGYRGYLMAHNVDWLSDKFTEIPEEDEVGFREYYRKEDE